MVRHRDSRKDTYASFYLRKRIYNRDAGQCQYCGSEVAIEDCNIDHVIPRSHQGITTRKNLVVACQPCNKLKDSQLIPEELRPRRGEAFLSRKEIRAGKKTKVQQAASDRMKGTISNIREASAMGVYLDDLFTEATQERWR